MRERNDFHLLFGPADDVGEIHISGDEIAARTAQQEDLFPMDYITFPGGWTGRIDAEVLNLAAIERFRFAAALWNQLAFRPESDPNLEAYENRLHGTSDGPLTAEVAAEN
jgi:hypothetical protein